MVVGIVFPFLPSEMVALDTAAIAGVQPHKGVQPQIRLGDIDHYTVPYSI